MSLTLMDGNEAIARAALAAGCRFFAGYPITPATTVFNAMLALLPPAGGICLQGEDEIASTGFCLGASMAGMKVMTATSGPGISLYSEHISFAIGSEIPIVIVDVQRLGPSTGSATKGADGDIQFLQWGSTGGLPVIVLAPVDVKDCMVLTVHAFNLAEQYRCPVFIASNKEIGMTRETVDMDGVALPEIIERRMAEEGKPYVPFEASDESPTPPFLPLGSDRLVRTTSSTHGADGYITTDPEQIARFQDRLFKKVQAGVDRFTFFDELETPGADTLVITYGVTARAAKVAVEAAGTFTEWSAFDTTVLEFGAVGGKQGITSTLPHDWEDAWAFRFGLKWQASDTFDLMAGYVYDQTPEPDGDVGPLLPDMNRNGYSIGFSWKMMKNVWVDASNLFRYRPGDDEAETMLDEYTRELVYLKPDVLVVYDRVDPKPSGEGYSWRLHFPVQPSASGGRYTATYQGGGITLIPLQGGAASVHADNDLTVEASGAWRVEEAAPADGRFLNVVAVASGAAPAPATSVVTSIAEVAGARVGDQVVVFSRRPRGAAVTLPFSYTVADGGVHTHTLVNVEAGVDVAVVRSGGTTTITVSAGSHAPDDAGLIRFSDE